MCARSTVPTAAPHLRAKATSVKAPAKKGDDVVAFFKANDLEALAPLLLKEGFDELETLASMDIEDIKEVAIAYNARLRRGLQELRGENLDGCASPTNQVVAFLEIHGMAQYAASFLESGFDEMLTLSEIEDEDLKDLGLSRGHALKLRRVVREYMLENHPEEAQEDQAQRGQLGRQLALQDHFAMAHQASIGSDTGSVRSERSASVHHARAKLEDATDQMKSDVVRSWEIVLGMGTLVFGELLYKNTFQLAPEAVDLFPLHVRQKHQEWDDQEEPDNIMASPALRKLFSKVVNVVGCAVAGLHDTAQLVPMLLQLGGRHINYGVPEPYWEVLGRALIITLREVQGPSFTADVEQAWSVVYAFISSLMIQGLRSARSSTQES